jgi:hypothetical protein
MSLVTMQDGIISVVVTNGAILSVVVDQGGLGGVFLPPYPDLENSYYLTLTAGFLSWTLVAAPISAGQFTYDDGSTIAYDNGSPLEAT